MHDDTTASSTLLRRLSWRAALCDSTTSLASTSSCAPATTDYANSTTTCYPSSASSVTSLLTTAVGVHDEHDIRASDNHCWLTTSTTSTTSASSSRDIKILVIGPSGSGKTAFVRRFAYNTFTERQNATIGVDFALKRVTVETTTRAAPMTSTSVRIQMWDIAGQDRRASMSRVFYAAADGAIVVYDLSNSGGGGQCAATARVAALQWKAELDQRLGERLPAVLIGAKSDIMAADWVEWGVQRSLSSLSHLQSEYNIKDEVYTSARLGTNIDAAVSRLVQRILADYGDRRLSDVSLIWPPRRVPIETAVAGTQRQIAKCQSC